MAIGTIRIKPNDPVALGFGGIHLGIGGGDDAENEGKSATGSCAVLSIEEAMLSFLRLCEKDQGLSNPISHAPPTH